jgi:hypothetical protein
VSQVTLAQGVLDASGVTDLPGFFGPFIAGEWPRSGWLMISST